MKIFLNTPDADRGVIKEKIRNDFTEELDLEVLNTGEEPVAFGVYAILVYVKTEDSERGSRALDEFQEILNSINEVDSVIVENQTLTH